MMASFIFYCFFLSDKNIDSASFLLFNIVFYLIKTGLGLNGGGKPMLPPFSLSSGLIELILFLSNTDHLILTYF